VQLVRPVDGPVSPRHRGSAIECVFFSPALSARPRPALTRVASPAPESCIPAETAELLPVASDAFEQAMSSCRATLVAELGHDGCDAPWVDPSSFANRIQEAMRSAFAEELPRSLKRFEDRITSHPAPSDRPNNGGIGARRQRGRANHSSDTQAPSSGTSVGEGNLPAQRPRTLLPLASASTVGTSVLSFHQNSDPHPAIHRQPQPQQHLTNGFSSSAGPQSLDWTPHLGQGMRSIVIPMLDRHTGGPPGMAPAASLWPNDGNPVQQGVQQGLPRTIHHSISYPGGHLAPYSEVFPAEQRPSSSPPLVYSATYQPAPEMRRPNPNYPHWLDKAWTNVSDRNGAGDC
jgi:hypothetical protein